MASLAIAALAVYAAWKNNYITKKGHEQKMAIEKVKKGESA
ncbi:phage holin [Halalkalibacter hemicellulosilyticus]|nr:phage holin [Halalkalibacter hemicellulosilyticus]